MIITGSLALLTESKPNKIQKNHHHITAHGNETRDR